MGAGKSTVGARLAERLQRPFVDLDHRIVRIEGVDIPTLFKQGRFRAVEARHLEQVLAGPPVVLATGGGAPCQPGAMDRLRSAGWTVWLDVPLDQLAQRVAGDPNRPLWDDAVQARFSERQPIYAQAHHRVDGTGADVAQRVLEAWHAR